MEEIEFEQEICFNETDYVIILSAFKPSSFDTNFRIMIDVEDKNTGDVWRGDFQQKYIEDICSKAGKPQKLQQFIKMLQIAIQRKEISSIYLDLLTQHDLLMLKARKQGLQVTKPTEPVEINSKRYLILTQTLDSDKVHFPMPLSYLEDPGVEVLRRTFTRMQSQFILQPEMNSTVKSMNSLSQIEQENYKLRDQIEGIEQSFAATQNFFNVAQESLEYESELDSYRQEADNKIKQIQQDVKNKERELQMLQREINKISTSEQDIEPVRKQLSTLNQELETEQVRNMRILQQSIDEAEQLEKQIQKGQENEQLFQQRMLSLQKELESMNKKLEQIQRGSGYGARANKQMNFGSDYSGGSRNNSNNSAKNLKSSERSNSLKKSAYVPLHLRPKISPVRSNVLKTSPNQRVGSQNKAVPVAGNRFGVDYKGNRFVGGNSGSRDRIPKINNNYQMKDPSPNTRVYDRLYQKKEPRSNSREPEQKQQRKAPIVPQMQRPPAQQMKPMINKENNPARRSSATQQAISNERITQTGDIDQKLSRLQDLLKLAKQN